MANTETMTESNGATASQESAGAGSSRREKNKEQKEDKPRPSQDESSQDESSQDESSQDDSSQDDSDESQEAEVEFFAKLAAATGLDEAAIERLRAAGLSDEQIEAVLGVAEDHLLPLARALAETHACEDERNKLIRLLGGEEAWQTLAPELLRWGKKSLPAEVFSVLASSAEGIQAMLRMRQAESEPSLIANAPSGAAAGQDSERSEDDLRRLMADPAYWSKRDPALMARVREGFRRLYPS